MLQIQRMIEKESPSGCWEIDRLEPVGPAFETHAGLYNYVQSVLPRTDWWQLQVADTSGVDEYGVYAEREVSDLADWIERYSAKIDVGDVIVFTRRGRSYIAMVNAINGEIAIVSRLTKKGRKSQRIASIYYVHLANLKLAR